MQTPAAVPTAPVSILADSQQALQLAPLAGPGIHGMQSIIDVLAEAVLHIANVVPPSETAALVAGPQAIADPPFSQAALQIQEEADRLASLRSSLFAEQVCYEGASPSIDLIQEAVQRQMAEPLRDACRRIDAMHHTKWVELTPNGQEPEIQLADATAGPAAITAEAANAPEVAGTAAAASEAAVALEASPAAAVPAQQRQVQQFMVVERNIRHRLPLHARPLAAGRHAAPQRGVIPAGFRRRRPPAGGLSHLTAGSTLRRCPPQQSTRERRSVSRPSFRLPE